MERSVCLSRQISQHVYNCHWEVFNSPGEFAAYEGVIREESWEPVDLFVKRSNCVETTIPLEGKAIEMRWALVRRMLSQKNGGERGTGTHTGGYKYREKYYDREVEWARGSRTFHPATKEIVERYHDHCNAVLILPDSWLDNKLQEAYSSKHGEDNQKDTK